MQIKFSPNYTITSETATNLMRIERAKEKIINLPLTPTVLNSLRDTARLYTTHYSTMIEGNVLSPKQIDEVLKHKGHFPGRERDEHEVKGYYSALTQVEQWTAKNSPITEKLIQTLHALVMATGKTKIKPTAFRDGQNVIRDSQTGAIVYMPPEAKDVPSLMKELVFWIQKTKTIPCPIVAAIAHYQFATIHPYYDGNGRTARLLTTFVLHLGGYDLKGLYSLEEYYARHLDDYYNAINIGKSHKADITKWIDYFIEGMAVSFENVLKRMNEANLQGSPDHSQLLRRLDPKQRKALSLFEQFSIITSKQVSELFGFQPRSGAQLCKDWVEDGFLTIEDASNKGRTYKLSKEFEKLI